MTWTNVEYSALLISSGIFTPKNSEIMSRKFFHAMHSRKTQLTLSVRARYVVSFLSAWCEQFWPSYFSYRVQYHVIYLTIIYIYKSVVLERFHTDKIHPISQTLMDRLRRMGLLVKFLQEKYITLVSHEYNVVWNHQQYDYFSTACSNY